MSTTLDFQLRNAPPELFDGIRWSILTLFILNTNLRNRVWVSQRTLAKRLKKSVPYVNEAIHWLLDHGALSVVPRDKLVEDEGKIPGRQLVYEVTGRIKFGSKTIPYLYVDKKKSSNDQPHESLPVNDQPGESSKINPVDHPPEVNDQPGERSTPANLNSIRSDSGSGSSISEDVVSNTSENARSHSQASADPQPDSVKVFNPVIQETKPDTELSEKSKDLTPRNSAAPPAPKTGRTWNLVNTETGEICDTLDDPAQGKARAKNLNALGGARYKLVQVQSDKKPKQLPQYGAIVAALVAAAWEIPIKNAPGAVKERAGEAVKLILADSPDTIPEHIQAFVRWYRSENPKANLPRDKTKIADWFGVWRHKNAPRDGNVYIQDEYFKRREPMLESSIDTCASARGTSAAPLDLPALGLGQGQAEDKPGASTTRRGETPGLRRVQAGGDEG